jgi:hypothetical protein
MKTILLLFTFILNVYCHSQETSVLLKEAFNLELKYNEPDALAKYKQVLVNDANHYKALQKATELSCNIGARQQNIKDKKLCYESALAYANRAYIVDSNNASSYYLLAVASGKMTEVEQDNKKKIAYAKDVKVYADKALKINPTYGLANFIEGKWHYEMVTLNWAKKIAIKTLYGGLPQPSLDKCIEYLEICKKQDPYFVLNYLTLAQAYKEADKAVKMIEVLKQLVKLPKRTFDDIGYIETGKKWLENEN